VTSRSDDVSALSRTERKRAERIVRIERAAAEVFADRGFESANFDDIAERLDLRGSSLFHYFPSKRDLFRRILHHSADQVFERLQAVVDAGGPPAETWERLVREQVVLQVRDFPEFAPLFFTTTTTDAELRNEVLELRRQHAAIFEHVAEAWRREVDADATSTRVRVQIVFGAMAYLGEWYRPDGPVKVEELAQILAVELALAPAPTT
jgi:AcrR family transcriptional regulator